MRLVSRTRLSPTTARMAMTRERPVRRRAHIGWITVAAFLGVICWGATAQAQFTVHLTSNINPSSYGQAVTFTATVTPAGIGAVDFLDGVTTICSNVPQSGGHAQCVISNLTPGTHTILATANGPPCCYWSVPIPRTTGHDRFSGVMG